MENQQKPKLSNFEREYFIQTRKEIDTEKRERDQMLNFAVLVLGGIGFGVSQSQSAQQFLQESQALVIEIPALIIITSLFWVRYKKLKQIADRWFALYRIVMRYFGRERVEEMLEGLVYKNLTGWRYILKDFVLNIALCLPVYALILLPSFNRYLPVQPWRLGVSASVIVLHCVISSIILGRKIHDPLPTLTQE